MFSRLYLFCLISLGVLANGVSVAGSFSTPEKLQLSSEVSSSDSSESSVAKSYEGWTGEPTKERHRQSPTTALFKSMLVPGLGQIGNRKHIKAALIIGGETFLFLRWLDFRNQTADARVAFEAENDLVLRGQLFAEFDSVRDKRNLSAWMTGTVIFISMIDAFVDAHLAKFPAPEKKLSFDVAPVMFDENSISGFAASVTWRF